MRLFDRLAMLGMWSPEHERVNRFIADEVAQRIDELPESNSFSPDASSYGCVAPPYDEFWIEAHTSTPSGEAWRGCFFSVTGDEVRHDIRSLRPPACHWQLTATGYMYARNTMFLSRGVAIIHLDREGNLLDDTQRIQTVEFDLPAASNDVVMVPPTLAAQFLPVALRALQLIHMSTMVDHVTPNRAARRRAERRGERVSDHYVIRVGANSGANVHQNVATPHNPPRERGPRGARRGYFRYYHPDRPMFGRVSGLIWTPPREADEEGPRHDYYVEDR